MKTELIEPGFLDGYTDSIIAFVNRYKEQRCIHCYRPAKDHTFHGNCCPVSFGEPFIGRTFTTLQMCEGETGESHKGAGDSFPCHRQGVVYDLAAEKELCLACFGRQ